jgi:O-acetylserine/cysteine efflux transporter
MKETYMISPTIIRWCFMKDPGILVTMTSRDSMLAALVASIWGFNFVVIHWGMEGVPPLLFAAIRFTVVLIPAVFFVPRPAVPWTTIVGVGLFMSLGQFGLLYLSIDAGMPPGVAALVLQAQVVFTIVISAGVLREIPTRSQVTGVVIGSVGLLIVAFGRGGDTPVIALVLCVMAALSWGIGNVISRSSGVKSGLSLTVWSALVVPIPLFALSMIVNGPAEIGDALAGFSSRAAVSTMYTAVLASLVGYTVFNSLLARYPPSAVVPWVLVAPIVAMGSAWLLLDERPNSAELWGGCFVIVGVLVALRPQRTFVGVPSPSPSSLPDPVPAGGR